MDPGRGVHGCILQRTQDQVTWKIGLGNIPSAQKSPSAETSLYVLVSFSFLRNAATELGSQALRQARLPLYDCSTSLEGVEAEVPPLQADPKSYRFLCSPSQESEQATADFWATLSIKASFAKRTWTECCNDSLSPPPRHMDHPLRDSSETMETQKRNGWLLLLLCLLLSMGSLAPWHLFHR